MRKKYPSILFLSTNTSPLLSFSLVHHSQKKRRRRRGRSFGGAPIALANKGHNKKVRQNYRSILFFYPPTPHLSFSLVHHSQKRRRRRKGWAFGGAPIALANKGHNKKVSKNRHFILFFQPTPHLAPYLLLSGPALSEEEEEEEGRAGMWWCADVNKEGAE